MATIAGAEIAVARDDRRQGSHGYSWPLLTPTNDRGAPVKASKWRDGSVHVDGAEGTGGHVKMQGSNKAAPVLTTDDDWFFIKDTEGNVIDITAVTVPEADNIGTRSLWIRPRVTAGNGSTSYNVHLFGV